MSNCILCEYYSSTGYHCEIVEKDKFDITQMDKRWEELFFFPMNQDSEGAWELTDCEVEPLFEISHKDNKWWWQTGRRMWFNNHYKLIYNEGDACDTIEEALEAALDAFENLSMTFEVTDLEDIDDDFTEIES